MKIPIYQVDAFTSRLFGGNPAAVCPLEEWPNDDVLRNIAIENNLAETAYFIKKGEGFHLRWFTPEVEMDLCGHATLASAHVIFEHLNYDLSAIRFETASGELVVKKQEDLLQMDFPSRKPEPSSIPDQILNALSIQPKSILKARDYFLVFDTEQEVRDLLVNQQALDGLDLGTGGIICTAKGEKVDFVSRFFTPGAAVFEDPATGSAHCSLVPYWSEVLGLKEFTAHQVSSRLGEFYCEDRGARVLISGQSLTYLEGEITV
ncbi:MAG: PhzF family phenazine biosynthesis protein [Cyclobacteriaceae bacterium]